jgi:hypothetical protein
MHWKTSTGRWIERHGEWRPWFAWKPVLLEPPLECEHDQPTTRAWLCLVLRKGLLIRGGRFWLYRSLDQIERPRQPAPPRRAGKPRLRVVK